ncbi:LOW QUALITY PROTEIN: hypothetical protein ACHAW6_014260 [Cyclotella cf. meneghiniana]
MAVGCHSMAALASFGVTLFWNFSTHALVSPFVRRVPRSPGHGQIIHSSINSCVRLATSDNYVMDENRRRLLSVAMILSHIFVGDTVTNSACADNSQLPSPIDGIHDVRLRNYFNPNFPNWKGTSLDVMSLEDAAHRISKQSNPHPTLPMGRWPDPALRKSAASVPSTTFQRSTQLQQLQSVAIALKNTARSEGAVGLAAQQCGVDASLIFIDGVKEKRRLGNIFGVNDDKHPGNDVLGDRGKVRSTIAQDGQRDSGIFLVNPRIVQRSSEPDMMVWTEECLVLPPEFRATLLRDARVTIEYESLGIDTEDCGHTRQITLSGEFARCAQHEMDHDRGVLIVDHVGLSELLSVGDDMFMANIENSDGLHESRMQRAYARDISESVLLPTAKKGAPLAVERNDDLRSRIVEMDNSFGFTKDTQMARPWFFWSANAMDVSPLPVRDPANPSRHKKRPEIREEVTLECDATCLERRRIIESRRAMMNQSRTNTNRGDVLKLSEQRAALYHTRYIGLPSKSCANPRFCP